MLKGNAERGTRDREAGGRATNETNGEKRLLELKRVERREGKSACSERAHDNKQLQQSCLPACPTPQWRMLNCPCSYCKTHSLILFIHTQAGRPKATNPRSTAAPKSHNRIEKWVMKYEHANIPINMIKIRVQCSLYKWHERNLGINKPTQWKL